MKFKNPLKGALWITQTYHENSSNKAIDISAVADAPVYAVGDGVISTATPDGNSYCVLNLDNSKVNVYYVHTYKWLKVGTKVKAGQQIAQIAPKTLNGGYPTHLHFGTQLGYSVMDYMDRTLTYKTGYADIKKSWFNNTESLNWSLFKDRTYLISEPTPTPVDPHIAEIETLQIQIKGLQEEISELKEDCELFEEENKAWVKDYDTLQGKYDGLIIERNRMENEKNKAIEELAQIKRSRFYFVLEFLEKLFPQREQ